MSLFECALIAATVLSGLVTGLVFTFAVVVMPGLARLADGDFLRAFQVIDGVIQDNQPLFMVVWLGSVVAVLVSLALGWGLLAADDRTLLIIAATLSTLGVQGPTATVNIPLNNTVQKLAIADMDTTSLRAARSAFEPRWNRWNVIRTLVACAVTVVLAVLLLRLS